MADDTEEVSLSYELDTGELETLAKTAGMQAGESLREAMATALVSMSGTISAGLQTGIDIALTNILPKLESATQLISATFGQISTAAQALSAVLAKSLGQTAGQSVQSMSGQFQTAFGSAIGFVDQLISGMGKINTVTTTFKSIGEVLGSKGVQTGFSSIASLLGISSVQALLFVGAAVAIATVVALIIQNWGPISTFFQNLWNKIVSVFKPNLISSAFMSAWNAIVAAWNGAGLWFKNIWNVIVSYFKPDMISNVFKNAWNAIVAAWNGAGTWFGNIWNVIISHFKPDLISGGFQSTWGAIQVAWSGVGPWFGNVWNSIKSGFDSMNPFEWGKDLLENFINGIKSKFDALKNSVNSIADEIKKKLHFSEPDEGPLVGFHTWMPDMMQGLASGILENKSLVTAALSDLTGTMALGLSAAPALAVSGVGASYAAQPYGPAAAFGGSRPVIDYHPTFQSPQALSHAEIARQERQNAQRLSLFLRRR